MNECTWFMNNSFNAHTTFLQLTASLLDTALPKRNYNMAPQTPCSSNKSLFSEPMDAC